MAEITKAENNDLWVTKYRPKTLDEMCLPQRLRDRFSSGEVDAHLLFGGKHGTGKTTLARILASQHTTKQMNGSSERKIDDIRKTVIEFCSTNSILQRGKKKVVLFNEAEKLTKDAQDALKDVTETHERNALFLFTSNHPERLSLPLHSRFEYVNFNFKDEAEIADLKIQYGKKILYILQNEGFKIDKPGMMHLIDNVFPDLRKITGMLYSASRKIEKSGTIMLEHLVDNTIENNTSLYETICAAHKPEELFMKIKSDFSGKELDALNSLGEPFLNYLMEHKTHANKVLSASMIVHKYNYESSTGDVDPLITLLACACALSQILK